MRRDPIFRGRERLPECSLAHRLQNIEKGGRRWLPAPALLVFGASGPTRFVLTEFTPQ